MPADGRFHRVGLLTRASGGQITAFSVATAGLVARTSQTGQRQAALDVQAPILSGDRTLQISYPGTSTQSLRVHFVSDFEDAIGDGTPDFLRLHTAGDRIAFRNWFTALAEAAADLPKDKLPSEIGDCAALRRWCYRNALHAHDGAWLSGAQASLGQTLPSVRQYVYTNTPLGSGLFRVREGAFATRDLQDDAFGQFANSQTLWRLNTFLLGKDLRSARPGDLLFFPPTGAELAVPLDDCQRHGGKMGHLSHWTHRSRAG